MRLIFAVALAACGAPRVEAPPVSNSKAAPPIGTTPLAKAALADLASQDWGKVYAASVVIGGHRAGALAGLVAMAERDDRVELVDTADLIYPGAKKFYGHGWAVEYDLDTLADRAGWVLEAITFRDFGFSDGVNAFSKEDPLRAASRRTRARAAVAAWWARAQSGWTCYDALAEALGGDRPRLAYAWLRDRNAAACPGFTYARFEGELEPIVKRHAADVTHPFHEQAKKLLDEAAELEHRHATVSRELALARVGMMTPDTTLQELEETIGKPVRDAGSGIHLFVYRLRDAGSYTLRVGTADGTSILHVSLDVAGNTRQVWKR